MLAVLAVMHSPSLAFAQQSAVRDITRTFQNLEKSICRSFDLHNCPSGKTSAMARPKTSKIVKIALPTAKKSPAEIAPKIALTPPKPRAKLETAKSGKLDMKQSLPKSEDIAKGEDGQSNTSPRKQLKQGNMAELSAAASKGFIDKKDQSRLGDRKLAATPQPKLKTQHVPNTAATGKESLRPKSPERQIETKSAAVALPRIATPPQLRSALDCSTELASLGVKFSVEAMPVAESKCTINNPVRLSELQTAKATIAFPDKPLLNCQFALHLAKWTGQVAGPLAKAATGQQLAAVSTGPGYECRNRNGDATGKTSEHASGNAVDIEAFMLTGGKRMMVKTLANPTDPDSDTLKAFQASACEVFTTVLGPGSNSSHEEHFHFDSGLHGKSGTYRICQ
jgi:hypothetical protein